MTRHTGTADSQPVADAFRCESCGGHIEEGEAYHHDADGVRWHKRCPVAPEGESHREGGNADAAFRDARLPSTGQIPPDAEKHPFTAPDSATGQPPADEPDAWIVEAAIAFAAKAHEGQVYRGYGTRLDGPYIMHPLRVMLAMPLGDPYAQALAVLHDVIEDTALDLPSWVPDEMQTDLAILSRDKIGETYEQYIERIAAAGPWVQQVKVADLRDNLAHDPPPNLRERYERALLRLSSASPVSVSRSEPRGDIEDGGHPQHPGRSGETRETGPG